MAEWVDDAIKMMVDWTKDKEEPMVFVDVCRKLAGHFEKKEYVVTNEVTNKLRNIECIDLPNMQKVQLLFALKQPFNFRFTGVLRKEGHIIETTGKTRKLLHFRSLDGRLERFGVKSGPRSRQQRQQQDGSSSSRSGPGQEEDEEPEDTAEDIEYDLDVQRAPNDAGDLEIAEPVESTGNNHQVEEEPEEEDEPQKQPNERVVGETEFLFSDDQRRKIEYFFSINFTERPDTATRNYFEKMFAAGKLLYPDLPSQQHRTKRRQDSEDSSNIVKRSKTNEEGTSTSDSRTDSPSMRPTAPAPPCTMTSSTSTEDLKVFVDNKETQVSFLNTLEADPKSIHPAKLAQLMEGLLETLGLTELEILTRRVPRRGTMTCGFYQDVATTLMHLEEDAVESVDGESMELKRLIIRFRNLVLRNFGEAAKGITKMVNKKIEKMENDKRRVPMKRIEKHMSYFVDLATKQFPSDSRK